MRRISRPRSGGRAELAQRVGHDRLQSVVVRPAPVHPVAYDALGEDVVGALGAALDPPAYALLGGRGQLAVAGAAPGPGREVGGEPAQYVAELFVGLVAVDVCPGPQLAPSQQAPVPGQQNAPVLCRVPGEGGVPDVLAEVRAVHAEQPQPPCQRAEMDVEQEAERGAGHLLGALHRVHLDGLARVRDVRGRYGPAVHGQPAGLGERDAGRLDDVAERGRAVGDQGRTSLAAFRREEEAQLRGDFEVDLRSVHAVRMSSGRGPGQRFPLCRGSGWGARVGRVGPSGSPREPTP